MNPGNKIDVMEGGESVVTKKRKVQSSAPTGSELVVADLLASLFPCHALLLELEKNRRVSTHRMQEKKVDDHEPCAPQQR